MISHDWLLSVVVRFFRPAKFSGSVTRVEFGFVAIELCRAWTMFEDADNFADIFRGGLPIYVLITIPLLLICSSNPVLASSEFNVQRMTQYDLHGNPLGKLFFNFFRANVVHFIETYSQILRQWLQVAVPQHSIWKQNHCTPGQHRDIAFLPGLWCEAWPLLDVSPIEKWLFSAQIPRFNCWAVPRDSVESWWPSYSATRMLVKAVGGTTSS